MFADYRFRIGTRINTHVFATAYLNKYDDICLYSPIDLRWVICDRDGNSHGRRATVPRHHPQGGCDVGQCRQFSISISTVSAE
jgi:hypothetical protein